MVASCGAVASASRLVNTARGPRNRVIERLVARRVVPVVFSRSLIDVAVVVEINIPRIARGALQPIKNAPAMGVEGIGVSAEVIHGTPGRTHRKPAHHVVL